MKQNGAEVFDKNKEQKSERKARTQIQRNRGTRMRARDGAIPLAGNVQVDKVAFGVVHTDSLRLSR